MTREMSHEEMYPELQRFKDLQEAHFSELSRKPTNAMVGLLGQFQQTQELKDFMHDNALANQAAIDLSMGSLAALLRFLKEAKTDRLPYDLRKTLVASLEGDALIQLDLKSRIKRKGLTPQKIHTKLTQLQNIKRVYISNNGLLKRKEGLDAVMRHMNVKKSTANEYVSRPQHDEWLQEYKDWVDAGKTVTAFQQKYAFEPKS